MSFRDYRRTFDKMDLEALTPQSWACCAAECEAGPSLHRSTVQFEITTADSPQRLGTVHPAECSSVRVPGNCTCQRPQAYRTAIRYWKCRYEPFRRLHKIHTNTLLPYDQQVKSNVGISRSGIPILNSLGIDAALSLCCAAAGFRSSCGRVRAAIFGFFGNTSEMAKIGESLWRVAPSEIKMASGRLQVQCIGQPWRPASVLAGRVQSLWAESSRGPLRLTYYNLTLVFTIIQSNDASSGLRSAQPATSSA